MSINPIHWEGNYHLPSFKDVRWRALLLLFGYLVLGLTLLGFSRKPSHILLFIAFGALLDVLLQGLLKNRKVFPLSALITCCSLAILLNWSHGIQYQWLPAFVAIVSKYLITFKGKHFYNPSLFAICFIIIFGGEYVTLAPSYQWYGSANSAWVMTYFVITGALLLFVFRINRTWLIGSFLFVFLIQTILRAYILHSIIPWQTLFIGAVTSPAFYLFTFYMITDPATSPQKKWEQIMVGASIAVFDFIFHMKFSLYTFFFAGFTVATIRYLYLLFQEWRIQGISYLFPARKDVYTYLVLLIIGVPVLFSFNRNKHMSNIPTSSVFQLESISEQHSGLYGNRGDLLERTDPRVAHIAKWILSVGDAVAIADVDLDGLQDIFLTQPLKTIEEKGKLYLNKGNFQFTKYCIPDLDRYLSSPEHYGVPGFAYFLDYDNDGDKDLFTGFGFGPSHIFENRFLPDRFLHFTEVRVPFLQSQNTVCLAANSLDFNNDGRLDMILTNTLHQYLPDYKDTLMALNIFRLPSPQYIGDRRMFHFMHESWHNANNGGLNYLLLNVEDETIFQVMDKSACHLIETRWSLAVGTLDINNDGFTDIYIANDFGKDDCYLNQQGKSFIRQAGNFYGDIGLDTYKGMNVSVADFDRNGKEDIYVSNVHHAMQAEGSLLWMNETMNGSTTVTFEEKATQCNVLNPNRFGWGAAVGDVDLNGWPDIIQANGMVDDSWDKKGDKPKDYWYFQAQIARTGPEIHSYADAWADIRGCYIYPNEMDRIYLNKSESEFKDVSPFMQFTHKANTRGVALVDFDEDGDLDVLITNQFGAPFLFKNKISGKRWLGLRMIGNGKNTNTDAVGTKVWLTYQKNGHPERQYKEIRLVNGFMAMGDTRLLFGLGDEGAKLDSIELKIQWHNGGEERIVVSHTNKYLTIEQK